MSMWNINSKIGEEVKTPRDIVQEQCEKLAEMTDGTIIARITAYDGEYKTRPPKGSTIAPSEFSNASNNIFFSIYGDKGFDVQSVLGENANDSEDIFVYELFITSEKTPKYKYRVFIINYGIGIYPVSIALAKDIANELRFEDEYISDIYENDFIEMLKKILGSSIVTNIIQKLMIFNH